ncbi:hypothetical protein J437_LFUL015421 [Ladona fulva]|uniref:Uncharacterized protein n=1 Tax=Ladona fulva TaxID=123851 RepID=A0A8K0KJV2_LADFU|nr:hypothetical protein J437_LFUL015421 [Ladona fulva]
MMANLTRDFFRAAEEEQPGYVPTSVPSRDDSVARVDCGEVRSRRHWDLRAVTEHRGARDDVQLLPAGGDGIVGEALSLVEEVPHYRPNDPIHSDVAPELLRSSLGMRIQPRHRLLLPAHRVRRLPPLLQFLLPGLQEGTRSR